MTARVRNITFSLSGALLLLTLLGAPLFASHAQEAAADDDASREAADADLSEDMSAEAFGIETETIPNPEDVIGDFVVGPGKFEATLEPGDSVTTEILITNRTGVDRRFNINVEDIAGSRDGSRSLILLGDDRGPYSIKDYLSFPTRSFDLPHGKRARVPVTVTIPAGAEPGGFYGSALVDTVSVRGDEVEEENGASVRSPVVQRIGALFFITVPGENIYEGTLQDFRIEPERAWYEDGPFRFMITYENTGASHLNPYGEIRVTNMFGEEVGFVELEPWFALPQSVRLREITWNRDMLYGKYTAHLALNRGYDDIVDERTVTFWVIPWKYIVAGLILLFVIFFIIRSFFRTFELRKKTN